MKKYKRYLMTLMAALAIIGCEESGKSSEIPGTQIPTDPGTQCTGDDCPKECEGENCPKECEGEDCNKECEGEDCPKECEGENCGEPHKPKIPDADGDTISDANEGYSAKNPAQSVDTDGDTVPDYLDEDSDNDTIPDSIEALNGGDPSKAPRKCGGGFAFRVDDADGNFLLDVDEIRLDANGKPLDTDGNGVPDFCDGDNDGDGVDDATEMVGGASANDYNISAMDCNHDGNPDDFGSPSAPIDCDGDTVPDYLDRDSDNDTIEDQYEKSNDSNKDGFLDRYSLDSDGDGIEDSKERGTATGTPLDSDGDRLYDFQDTDSDNDGLEDGKEIFCDNLQKDSRIFADVDEDGESDLAEYLVAKGHKDSEGKPDPIDPKELVCDKNVGVKDKGITFYFELPQVSKTEYEEGVHKEKVDTLDFEPQVNKADIFINIDHAGNNSSNADHLQTSFKTIAEFVQARVPDVAFGYSVYGKSSSPFDLRFPIIDCSKDGSNACCKSDNPIVACSVAFQQALKDDTDLTSNGGYQQLGYTALHKIATDKRVGFRNASIPIVVHFAFFNSVEDTDGGKPVNRDSVIQEMNDIGARIIVLNPVATPAADQHANNYALSKQTNSAVPECAYSYTKTTQSGSTTTVSTNWICDGDYCPQKNADDSCAVPTVKRHCCTNNFWKEPKYYNQYGVDPDSETGLCVLNLESGQAGATFKDPVSEVKYDGMSYELMIAIEALVKFGTYDVAIRMTGDDIPESDRATNRAEGDPDNSTTKCFFKKVEAEAFLPPEDKALAECMTSSSQPEKATFDADGKVIAGADCEQKGECNGFTHFAVGQANPDSKDKAHLKFKVTAENQNCVKPSDEARSYHATVEVYNPKTGAIFGTHEVAIIVPGFAAEIEIVN